MFVRSALAIFTLIPAAVGGCAGSSSSSAGNFSGPQAAVAKVFDNLSSDATSRSTAKICNQLLAADVAQRLKAAGGSCETVVNKQLQNVDNFNVKVQSVKITGNTAVASVKSTNNGKDHLDTLSLVRAPDGSWRLESLG